MASATSAPAATKARASTRDESSPRLDGRRVRGANTRRAILRRAMQIASVEGLDGLSLAGLAADLEMSKSGLFAHFGSKEELQLSTLRAARRVFSDQAVTPAEDVAEGIRRLEALLQTPRSTTRAPARCATSSRRPWACG
jgi:AcrR family transcriptional regulator